MITLTFLLRLQILHFGLQQDHIPACNAADYSHIYYANHFLRAFCMTFCLFWLPEIDGKVNG